MAKVTKLNSIASKLHKTEKDFSGLRETLFEEMDRLRNGLSDPTNANATARLASEITKTVTAEMKLVELQIKLNPEQKGQSPLLMGAPKLGGNK
jgi:hypothetical protein